MNQLQEDICYFQRRSGLYEGKPKVVEVLATLHIYFEAALNQLIDTEHMILQN